MSSEKTKPTGLRMLDERLRALRNKEISPRLFIKLLSEHTCDGIVCCETCGATVEEY